MGYKFDNYEEDTLTKPRDKAWDSWMKFEKPGDKVQGYIRDVFYRPEEDDFSAARGITLEQEDGTLINVSIKRFSFILSKTNGLRLNDPLTVVFSEQKTPTKKGHSGVKVFDFFGTNLPENKDEKTVFELDAQDMKEQNVEMSDEEKEGEDKEKDSASEKFNKDLDETAE